MAVRRLNVPYLKAKQMLVWEFNQRLKGMDDRREEQRFSVAKLQHAIYTGQVKDPPSVWELSGVDKPEMPDDYYKADESEIEKMKRKRE